MQQLVAEVLLVDLEEHVRRVAAIVHEVLRIRSSMRDAGGGHEAGIEVTIAWKREPTIMRATTQHADEVVHVVLRR